MIKYFRSPIKSAPRLACRLCQLHYRNPFSTSSCGTANWLTRKGRKRLKECSWLRRRQRGTRYLYLYIDEFLLSLENICIFKQSFRKRKTSTLAIIFFPKRLIALYLPFRFQLSLKPQAVSYTCCASQKQTWHLIGMNF